jgi:hypothetical protein
MELITQTQLKCHLSLAACLISAQKDSIALRVLLSLSFVPKVTTVHWELEMDFSMLVHLEPMESSCIMKMIQNHMAFHQWRTVVFVFLAFTALMDQGKIQLQLQSPVLLEHIIHSMALVIHSTV